MECVVTRLDSCFEKCCTISVCLEQVYRQSMSMSHGQAVLVLVLFPIAGLPAEPSAHSLKL